MIEGNSTKSVSEILTEHQSAMGKENLNKTVIEKNCYYVKGIDCDIIIPKAGGNYVSMQTDACDINMKLPSLVAHAKGYISENGTVIYESYDKNVSFAVQALSSEQNGILSEAVRTMITIENANAPTEYRFSFDFPDGYSLVKDYDYEDSSDECDCGTVYIVDENNEIASTIEAAWAKYANGNSVETNYRIEGKTLIQYVKFDVGSAFPIIADPTSHPTKYTHYYVDYPTLKGVIYRGYESCNTLGVSIVTYILGYISGSATGAAPVVGMMLVADLWSYFQFNKVKKKYNDMGSNQWLKTTYKHTWRNGGQNSGYVRSATAELSIVDSKGE